MIYKDLVKLLSYNKNTGIFRWKQHSIKNKIGCVAGYVHKSGYIYIAINKKLYRAHRLAWLYEYGKLPKNTIDHINHIKTDNRICNLRDVPQAENLKNKSKRKSTSGFTGVNWKKLPKKWAARIKVNGKDIHLGLFSDIDKAKEERDRAKILYGFHCNHS